MGTVFIQMIAGRLFISKPIFPNIFCNFWKINSYFGESNYSSRSVIDMMHYYDKHGYSRGWGKNLIHHFGGAIIRVNTVYSYSRVFLTVYSCKEIVRINRFRLYLHVFSWQLVCPDMTFLLSQNYPSHLREETFAK